MGENAASFCFLASLQERSGISFDQDEATIRLRVPQSERPHMVGMVALTDCVLRVTVEVLQNREDQHGPMEQRTKRKPGRTPAE
jgi:hypothetical protein